MTMRVRTIGFLCLKCTCLYYTHPKVAYLASLWYDNANRQVLEHLPEGVMMRQAVHTLKESYADMIGRLSDFYDRKFDRRWLVVARETRNILGGSDEVQEALDLFEPEYMSLRAAEANLYEPLERNDGLVACDELYKWHNEIEQDFHTRLCQLPGISVRLEDLLFTKAVGRTVKYRQLRREVRLAIDQGMFILDDVERKAERHCWNEVDVAADAGVWYLQNVLMPLPPDHR